MNTPDDATEKRTDILDPARAAALQATLGHAVDIAAGSPLPPFFHQLYFWSPSPPGGLGRDGHARVGTGLIPDLGLPRRMWAGGRLEFRKALIAGHRAERISRVDSVSRKQGRTGPLAFVTLRHDFHQDGALCLAEWQDLVYRAEPDPTAPQPAPPAAPGNESDARAAGFDSTLLFRYSALTFNGHRIHYDQTYARDVEGYGDLVVHGPLLAQLLMLMATDQLGPLATFAFRAASPLMAGESATLCRLGHDLWVRGPDGRLCMNATAHPRA